MKNVYNNYYGDKSEEPDQTKIFAMEHNSHPLISEYENLFKFHEVAADNDRWYWRKLRRKKFKVVGDSWLRKILFRSQIEGWDDEMVSVGVNEIYEIHPAIPVANH